MKKDSQIIVFQIIHEEWSDLLVKGYKQLKGLKSENLRDHMTEEELIFTALAELSTHTPEISRILSAELHIMFIYPPSFFVFAQNYGGTRKLPTLFLGST